MLLYIVFNNKYRLNIGGNYVLSKKRKKEIETSYSNSTLYRGRYTTYLFDSFDDGLSSFNDLVSQMSSNNQRILTTSTYVLKTKKKTKKMKKKKEEEEADEMESQPYGEADSLVKRWFYNTGGEWSKTTTIASQPWITINETTNKTINSYKTFQLFAFDFECTPSVLEPFMVCLTRLDDDSVCDFVGKDCQVDFLKWLVDYLYKVKPETLIIVCGFNSARFDNIFVAQAMARVELPRGMRFDYLESSGKLIGLGLSCRESKKLIFRDVLQYYPAGLKGSLRAMAQRLGLVHQKDDCSLSEMQTAGELVLNSGGDYADNPVFKKVLDYCRQDTRVVYGIGEYIGKMICAIPGAREIYMATNEQVIPPSFMHLARWLTVSQMAIALLPHASPSVVVHSSLSQLYHSVNCVNLARYLKCSIYGGRTLAGVIGQPLRGLASIDVCSEYPSAMLGPMPCGKASHPSINWINLTNRKLATALRDGLFVGSKFQLVNELPKPFIAHCRLFKSRLESRHHATSGEHFAVDVLPFVPWRSMTLDYICNIKQKSGRGSTEWLADTNGKTLYGIYTCVDIVSAIQLGFSVQLTTAVRPIVWSSWDSSLGEVFASLFKLKHQAGLIKDDLLKEAVKLLLNSSIGRFGMDPREQTKWNGITLKKTGKFKGNTSLLQINAFCMSYSRIINRYMQLLATHGSFDPQLACQVWERQAEVNRPIYTDTDNLIFIASNLDIVREAIVREQLEPSPCLGRWEHNGSFIRFTIEFERWHNCPACPATTPLLGSGIFLGKKSYIMACLSCPDAVRLKAKGHNKSGIEADKLATLLRQSNVDSTQFMRQHDDNNVRIASLSYFACAYPTKSQDQLEHLTSGRRVSFQIVLASRGKLSVTPSFVTRTYCACMSPSQTRCPLCLVNIHK